MRVKVKMMVQTKVEMKAKSKTMEKKNDGKEVKGRKSGSSVPASGVSLGRQPAAGAPALQCAAAEGGVGSRAAADEANYQPWS